MEIICLGEALIDFKSTGPLAFQGYVGGSPLNVAVAAARLGARVGFASQVSSDMFGEAILAHMRANGVLTDLVLRSDDSSTLAFVSEREGETHFSFLANGSADTRYDPQPRPRLPEDVRFLQFGSISLLKEPAASAIGDIVAAHEARTTVVLDPNVRPALIADREAYLAKLGHWLALAAVVKVSLQDLRWLYPAVDAEAAAAAWLERGPRAVVVTRGGDGATLLRIGRAPLQVDAFQVGVVDTVGAGDTFTAALMVALARRREPLVRLADEEAAAVLSFAAVAAALSCTRAGADPPTREEVEAVLQVGT